MLPQLLCEVPVPNQIDDEVFFTALVLVEAHVVLNSCLVEHVLDAEVSREWQWAHGGTPLVSAIETVASVL